MTKGVTPTDPQVANRGGRGRTCGEVRPSASVSHYDDYTGLPAECYERGLCRSKWINDGDHFPFFAPESEVNASRAHFARVDLAKDICSLCPVKKTCLAWAVPQVHLYGVWGGTTEGERRELRAGVRG